MSMSSFFFVGGVSKNILDRAFASETKDSSLIPDWIKLNTKNWYSQFSCSMFNLEKYSLKPPLCDRLA